jgi:hypothetical protein
MAEPTADAFTFPNFGTRPRSSMQEGAEAFRAGAKNADNPYAGMMDRLAWNKGWMDAAVDAGLYTRSEP